MNLRDLEYLKLVDKHQHFGKAAKEGNISQPALSMQIRKLEDQLKIKIFERNRKKIITTDLGKEILAIAKNILDEKEKIIQIAKSAANPYSGDLKLALFPTLAPYLLPKIIPEISKELPKLKLFFIENKTEQILEGLISGNIECALLALPINSPQLEFVELFTDRFYLAVNNKNPLAKKKSVTKKDLTDKNLLLLDEGHCLRDQALDLCRDFGISENHSFRASTLETLRQMIAVNSGITLIPEIAIDNNPLVSYIPFYPESPQRKIGLIYRRSSIRKIVLLHIAKIIRKQIIPSHIFKPKF